MSLWKLDPIDLGDRNWDASTYKGKVVVSALAVLALAQEPSSGEAFKAEPADVVLTRVVSVFTESVAKPNDPDAVPARVMTQTVLVTNVGSSAAAMDSTVITDSIPPGAELIVTDIDALGAGPVGIQARFAIQRTHLRVPRTG